MVRLLVHVAVAVFTLSAFGVQVCPHLNAIGPSTVMILWAACFAVGLVGRFLLQGPLVEQQPPLAQPARQLWLDFGVYVVVAVLFTLANIVVTGGPLSSGVRVLFGALTLGLFAGLDSALLRERSVLLLKRKAGAVVDAAEPARFFSLSRKFAAVSVALFTLLTADLLLLGMKDIADLLKEASALLPGAPPPQRELMIESIVALAVFVPLLGNLVFSFARNLRLFLENQREVLEAVARGELDVQVPVASHDEFAFIATRTNQMIEGLRERRRISELVGKLVSPAIATRLLESKDGLKLGGSRRKVVVLFSDVRNFTTRTENADPEALVADLNRYFTEMVDCVHAHGGIVDKFIGDGLMAIFGLEQFDGAAEVAVLSALEMHRRVETLNKSLQQPIAIGIGIHAGEVIAGTIGAPNRLEFTFIGDAVNAAARIEGLTKELQTSTLISQAVKDALTGSPTSLPWQAAGEQALKGKLARVALYRLPAEVMAAA